MDRKYKPLPIQTIDESIIHKASKKRNYFAIFGLILASLLFIAGIGAVSFYTASEERKAEIKAIISDNIIKSKLFISENESLIIPLVYNYNGKNINLQIEAYPKNDETINIIIKINNLTMDDITKAIEEIQGIEI